VVVIGGGPGGMEATRRLTALGHKVTLLEKADRLGGTLRVASIAYEPNERLLDWLIREVEASGADIRLGTEATPELVRTFEPAAVVVATGAVRTMPDLPGADRDHVFGGADLHKLLLGQDSAELRRKTSRFARLTAQMGQTVGATPSLIRKATRVWMPLGKSVVIYGGSLVGLELAEFLRERGRKVAVVDAEAHFGAGLQLVRRMRLLEELKDHGVALHPAVQDFRIEAKAVSFRDAAHAHHEIPADSVIVAAGAMGDLGVAETLQQHGFKVYACGDCTGVGYIEGAVRGAQRAVEELSARLE
jgi:NADPH-dependent 2,4-dienoyl-CoA reductase/sulfur reductase-like enzyme